MQISLKEADRLMQTLTGIIAGATGKEPDVVKKDMDRDYWLSAPEAMEYGLIDKVLKPGAR